MEILYMDDDLIVGSKPARVLSTDEPGGMPDLIREHLGDPQADIRTVHRLDRVVRGMNEINGPENLFSVLHSNARR